MGHDPEIAGGVVDRSAQILYELLGTMGVGPYCGAAATRRWIENDEQGITLGSFRSRCTTPEEITMRWPFGDVSPELPDNKDVPVKSVSELKNAPPGSLAIVEGVPVREHGGAVRLRAETPKTFEPLGTLSALRLDVPGLALLAGVKLGVSVLLGDRTGAYESIRRAHLQAIHAIEQPSRAGDLRTIQPSGTPLGYVQGRVARVDGNFQIKKILLNAANGQFPLGLPGLTTISGDGYDLAFRGNLHAGEFVRMRIAAGPKGKPDIVSPPVIYRLD